MNTAKLCRCVLPLLLFAPSCGITLLSEAEEIRMGLEAYPEATKGTPEIQSGQQVAMVNRVMQRLVPHADADVKQVFTEPFAWEVKLLDAPKVANAWCLPGGKMAVYTGILPICESEDGIAVVMSHEIAHAVKRHGNQRISQNLILGGILTAGAIALGQDDRSREENAWILAALGLGARYGVQLPYSRSHESEADAYGLELMIQAGYDPHEAVRLWQRMAQRGNSVPEFMSTHPDPMNRAKAIEQLIPTLQAKYRRG